MEFTLTEGADDFPNGADNTGNDTIFGLGGNDTILGGAGADIIDGGEGDDIIDGGSGDDTIVASAGQDQVSGGAGFDVLDLSAFNDQSDDVLIEEGTFAGGNFVSFGPLDDSFGELPVRITLPGGSTILATSGFEDIILDETLRADDGDRLFGFGGDDSIIGGVDDDVISGGAGNDTLIGGGGTNDIDGGDGNDSIDASGGNGTFAGEFLQGGSGDDTITGSGMDDLIFGDSSAGESGTPTSVGTGDDLIDGGAGDDTILAGAGNDTVTVGTGNDVLTGGDGTDTLDFSNFSDATVTGDLATGLTITLADGSIQTANGFEEIIGLDPVDPGTPDVLASTGEDETLDGGAGDDTITYTTGGGSDSIIGGADTDTLIVSGDDTGNTVSLANEAGESSSLELEVDGATSTVEEVEDITINTGAGGDTVTTSGTLTDAGVSQNTITVDLGDGADTFIVGGANVTHDEIDGGAGDDTLSLTDDVANTLGVFDATDLASLTSDGTVSVAEDGTVSFDLGDASYTASNFESIEINGTTFSLTEEEPVPDNVITGNDRGNLLISGSGNDSLVGNGGNDWMFGNSGNDTLDGGSGNDLMFGGSGDDSLDGGEGCDILFAGSGDDTLDGGSGLNILSGGRGNDTFKFTFGEAGKNTTFITDFGRGDDQLVLTDQNGQAVGSYDELKEIAEITQGRFGDLTIDFGNDVLVISNFSEDELKNLFAGFDVA